MKSIFRHLVFYLLFTIYCLIFVCPTYAHKVNIYAYAENGMVHTESYFVDGTKCKNSVLEIFDTRDGTKLLEGKTDEEGRFSFEIPRATSLKIVLHASMGHQAEFTVVEDEVRDAMGLKQLPRSPTVNVSPKSEGGININTQKKESPDVSKLKGISKSEIEAIVENALDKKLQPVMKMLIKLQENSGKPGITEIIGGIGYIIGILGIIAYFKVRRK